MLGSAIPATAVILAKNEEAAIESAVRSVSQFDQIVVVDSNSNDQTVTKALALGADTVNFSWDGRYPKKKQWILQHELVRHDWVLYVDADERPTQALLDEIRTRLESPSPHAAYSVRLIYHFAGKILHRGHQISKTVFVNRTRCYFPVVDDLWVEHMWEVEGHYQPICDGRVGQLTERLHHVDPDFLYHYFSRHNRYSDWEAHLNLHPAAANMVNSARTRQGQMFSKVPLKPVVFFLYSFLLRRGFLDGRAGFDYAVSQMFYYWQVGVKANEIRFRQQNTRAR